MALLKVIINGCERRLSQLALEILGLEKVAQQNKPITLQKLPPNLEILKIQKAEKAEPVVETTAEKSGRNLALEATAEPAEVTAPAEPVVEVKKNEDVTVAKSITKRRSRDKVGVKE